MIDADLAEIYGVPTRAINQAVRRNLDRFLADFMFRLTHAEKQQAVTNCDRLTRLRYSPTLPAAFTEHGALMNAACVTTRSVGVSAAQPEGPPSLPTKRVVTREQNLRAATLLGRFYPGRPRDVLFIGAICTRFAPANVRCRSLICRYCK